MYRGEQNSGKGAFEYEVIAKDGKAKSGKVYRTGGDDGKGTKVMIQLPPESEEM